MTPADPAPDQSHPRTRAKKRDAGQTRELLVSATIQMLRTRGITGASARTVAAEAGVNQALIFYHFGDMDGLLTHACQRTTQERVIRYREQFASVTSLKQLLAVGQQIHDTERVEGNVSVLAQLLAAGQSDPKMAQVTADALNLWVVEIEDVLTRVLRNSPLQAVIDPPGLSRAVAAAFIGLELYEGVDPAGGAAALAALDQLAAVAQLVEELGPLSRLTVRSRLRKAANSTPPS